MVPKTSYEFNEKYKKYLEKGHYGMSIDDEEILKITDKAFEEFIKIPGFTYSQIKTKFGTSRVYTSSSIDPGELEKEIDKLLLEKRQ